jgi:hypothetical protein
MYLNNLVLMQCYFFISYIMIIINCIHFFLFRGHFVFAVYPILSYDLLFIIDLLNVYCNLMFVRVNVMLFLMLQ